jgi:hypothetical protein
MKTVAWGCCKQQSAPKEPSVPFLFFLEEILPTEPLTQLFSLKSVFSLEGNSSLSRN